MRYSHIDIAVTHDKFAHLLVCLRQYVFFLISLSLSLRGRLSLNMGPTRLTVMLEQLRCTCEAAGCDRALDDEHLMLAMTTNAGTRRAYECDCGAVTVTVVRE